MVKHLSAGIKLTGKGVLPLDSKQQLNTLALQTVN
ncbi:hypothetical protein PSOS111911_03070 [Pseudoalteromonas ostreae]